MCIILIYYNYGPDHNIWQFYAAFALFFFAFVEIKLVPSLFGTELRHWSFIKDEA